MTAATNPRRRPARVADDSSNSLVDSFQNMSIRKGDTFHPTSNAGKSSSFWDPLESRARTPSMPERSSTSPQSLEDLLIGAGERRVADLLTRVDKAVAANSKAALAHVLSDPEVLPVPSLTVTDENDAPRKARTRHHSHSSDSGIGSSIADSTETIDAKRTVTRTAHSEGGQSFSSIAHTVDEERGLSKYAVDQIRKHIVQPILNEAALKEFHPLVQGVPTRIGKKQIKTLRELEKTLLFLAPDYSDSSSKYLHFCERTIRVLHGTVTTLHESDQRAPTDRPYTQGYFFDLVGQIRRYASILAATRARQEQAEELDDTMDAQEGEHVSLHGGMTHNGKPAELVRHLPDGKVISVATGKELTEDELAQASMKRSAELGDLDDEDALRSMARRKKNAKPEIHTCELCQKEFKRPCDLTKHVKTHERPWKCPIEDCKYHEYGWPTEKERDRHVNDKHSSTPSLYHCLYKPCPYTSKRESNCKQHMEKAHGWNYVRSKSNGKGRASSNAMRLNQGSVPPSPSSAMLTPLTPIAPSPSVHSYSESSRQGSMAPPSLVSASNHGTPAFTHPSPDFSGHFNMDTLNFDFNDMQNYPMPAWPMTPALSEDRRGSASVSSHSDIQFDGSSFDDMSPQDFALDNLNWQGFDYSAFTPNSSVAGPSSAAPALVSPGAQMDQTFTDDAMHVDGDFNNGCIPSEDFILLGTAAPAPNSGDMFPSIPEGSWNNYDMNSISNMPALPTSNTNALEELFPELKNQH